jgi:hypothetical protein
LKANAYDIKLTRVSRLILGGQKPRLFTQFCFYLSLPLLVWYYFFYGFLLVSIRMVNELPNAVQVREGIALLGESYGITDMEGTFLRMGLTGIVSASVFLAGLLLFWRRKKVAYLLFGFGILGCLFCPWLFFGISYFTLEQSAWEWAYPSTLMVILGIDYATRGNRMV